MQEKSQKSSVVKDALAKIQALKQEIAGLRAQREPIAIVGLGCRFPGDVASDNEFWRLLTDNVDAIGAVPEERRRLYEHAGRPEASEIPFLGGFISNPFDFAADFFQISPRELEHLDPQQRLLLEVTWEALENAGAVPSALRGSETGVFVGIGNDEFLHLVLERGMQSVDPYVGSGNSHSVAAGRLSHFFDWRGPSVSVDTACSSALVALQLAHKSLLAGECSMAVVGSVSCLLSPAYTIGFAKAGMLAKNGRCKVFADDADGYVRAEGCGVVVLKLLSQAERDGDRVRAIIRSAVVNHDGHCSGLTVPSRAQQRRLIAGAVEAAGLEPKDIGYIEAHGTGTALGDPIELGALQDVFCGAPRAEGPLLVGSVKANIGHLEPAAGMAGLIKAILMLERREIPAQIHAAKLTTKIDWKDGLTVPRQNQAWHRAEGPRYAGVSSFGFGGTNAHVVLQEATRREGGPSVRPLPYLLKVSARSRDELTALTARYIALLKRTAPDDLQDVCFTANACRDEFAFRHCVSGSSCASLLHELEHQSSVKVERDSSPSVLLHGFNAQTHEQIEALFDDLFQRFDAFRSAWERGGYLADRNQAPDSWRDAVWGTLQRFFQQLGVSVRLAEVTVPSIVPLPSVLWFSIENAQGSGAPSPLLTTDGVALTRLLAAFYLEGGEVDWRAYYRGSDARKVDVPSYAFKRQRSILGEPSVERDTANGGRSAPLFSEVWRPLPPVARTDEPRQRWLLVSPAPSAALCALAQELAPLARECLTFQSYHDALEHLSRETQPLEIVIFPGRPSFADTDDENLPSIADEVMGDLVALKALVARALQRSATRLWAYSDHPVWDGERALGRPALFASPTLGFLKSLRLEHPGLVGGLLSGDGTRLNGQEFLHYLRLSSEHLNVVVRDGTAYAPRLEPAATDARPAPLRVRSEMTYLVTGGGGGLGRHIIGWLQSQGARHIAVMGRGAIPAELLADSNVRFYRADVTSESQLRALGVTLAAEMPPVAGIIHAAGVNENERLEHQSESRFREIIAVKLLGSLLLQRCFASPSLEFFLGVSSIAGIWGASRMQAYSAASHFQNQLCRSLLFPAAQRCVDYGPWANTGMVNAEIGRLLQRQALGMLSVSDGLQALERALNHGESPLIAVAADWPRFVDLLRLPAAQSFFEKVVPVHAAPPPATASASNPLGLAEVRAVAAGILGLPADDFDVEAPLHALGMDSILALEFQRALQSRTDKPLPRTLIFDYPTVAAIHRHLGAVAGPTPSRTIAEFPEGAKDIAIIGASLRAPGAGNLEQFWDLLDAGQDAIGHQIGAELAKRAGRAASTLTACPAYHGGLLDGVELFDAERFNLSRREAELMDPQQRLMLEAAWHAFEHAGYAPQELHGQRCGVFVGTGNFDYREICREHAKRDGVGLIATSNVSSVIPGRIAYFFDLKGPSLAVDTACSSSLTALHLACLSLRAGESAMALAGGVNLVLSPDNHLTLHESKMLSESGVCSVFDAHADGYVRSEAAGFVLLKPLERALADGDRVLGVIRGTGVNQDGRSSSLTAPNGIAQREVMRAALAAARLAPEHVDIVEAHGTGTSLGDPIELQAIDSVYGQCEAGATPLYVTAVKANIGHAEAASGIVSLCKALGVFARHRLPRQIHYAEPNPNARIESTRVHIAEHDVAFPSTSSLRIGISSFGFSGSNVHVILESPPGAPKFPAQSSADFGVFLLSASSEAALARLRRQYQDYAAGLDDEAIADVLARAVKTGAGGTWRLAGRYRGRAGLASELAAASPVNAPLEARELRLAQPSTLDRDFPAQRSQLRRHRWLWSHFAELMEEPECDVARYSRALTLALRSLGIAARFVERDEDVLLSGDVWGDFERIVVAAHLAGQNPAYEVLDGTAPRPRAALPASAFQRKRFWICDAPEAAASTVAAFQQLIWVESERPSVEAPNVAHHSGAVLIVSNDPEQCAELVSSGRKAGIVPFVVQLSEARTGADGWIVTPDLAIGLREALARIESQGISLRCSLFAVRDPNPIGVEPSEGDVYASARAAHALVEFVRTAVGSNLAEVPLWVLTRGAQSVTGVETQIDVAAAMLWGVVNVVRCEYPAFSVACLELDDARSARIWPEVLGGEPRTHLAWRDGKRYVPELRPWAAADRAERVLVSAAGSYVVAGGLGGIGLELVRWLLEQGARHVVVLGRRASGVREAELQALMEQYGANIISVAVDIVNRAELERCFAALASTVPPFKGVIQAAGVLDDRLICNSTTDTFVAPVAVKAHGTLNLHWVTRDAQLDFFVCLSSTTAFLGNVGQVSHAAANAALDAIVRILRRDGVAAQAIAWGPWRDVGLAAHAPSRYFEAFGIEPFATAHGLDCFAHVLAHRPPHVLALRIDWERFQAHRGASVLGYVLPAGGRVPVHAPDEAEAPLAATNELEVLATTRRLVSDVLKLEVATVSDTQPFHSLGVDSVMAVQIATRLAEDFRCSFNSTVIFDYPNVEKLASHIWGINQRRASASMKHQPVAAKLQSELDEIAVWLEQ